MNVPTEEKQKNVSFHNQGDFILLSQCECDLTRSEANDAPVLK